MSSSAFAAFSWPQLPLACLPERAAPWQDGKSEAQQEACHCPPTDMCPSSYEEYKDNSKAKLPMSFVLRCCPVLENPNPPVVTETEGCPSKYYPTLTESGVFAGTKFTNKYVTQFPVKQYNFTITGYADSGGYAWTARLQSLFNWSLRTSDSLHWVWGPAYCNLMTSGTGGSACPFQDGYMHLTNNINDGRVSAEALVSRMGADNLTWFGISFALVEKLPDNLATESILAQWGSRELVQIADNHTALGVFGKQNNDVYLGGATEEERGALVDECRLVQGEYLALEYKEVNGQQCPYIQCRYVYESVAESCLSASASVTLSDGTKKAASELTVGDRVKTETGAGKVTATNRYQSGLRVLYGINGSEALLTGDHPVRTTDGWKVITEDAVKLYADKPGFAKTALAVGDTLITEAGEVKVTAIERFAKVDPVSTYNIKVEGGQGFYADGFEVKGFDRMEMQYK